MNSQYRRLDLVLFIFGTGYQGFDDDDVVFPNLSSELSRRGPTSASGSIQIAESFEARGRNGQELN